MQDFNIFLIIFTVRDQDFPDLLENKFCYPSVREKRIMPTPSKNQKANRITLMVIGLQDSDFNASSKTSLEFLYSYIYFLIISKQKKCKKYVKHHKYIKLKLKTLDFLLMELII